MIDPEIRDLQVATARAYAVAERLAYELEDTVEALLSHVGSRSHADRTGDDSEVPGSSAAQK